MPTPLFLQSETHAIAVHSAGGDSRLAPAIQENAAILNLSKMTGIGAILDSDKQDSAAKRYSDFISNLAGLGFDIPATPGIVASGSPNFGALVLPDNNNPGTLEDILIQSANKAYPGLLASAQIHIEACGKAGLSAAELKEFNKPSGRAKAVVGSIASILRPGKAVQVSIQDNDWFKGDCLNIPAIYSAQQFLKTLFAI